MVEVGDKLANGATVLAVEPGEGAAVVMATWTVPGGVEYVTWRLDDEGVPFAGRYFDDVTAASRDFAQRAGL